MFAVACDVVVMFHVKFSALWEIRERQNELLIINRIVKLCFDGYFPVKPRCIQLIKNKTECRKVNSSGVFLLGQFNFRIVWGNKKDEHCKLNAILDCWV